MDLLVAEELLVEILEPDKAELQPVGREFHAAQGKDDGIEGRKDREDQNQRDSGRNENRCANGGRTIPRQLSPMESPAGRIPGWPRCRRCGDISGAAYLLAGAEAKAWSLDLGVAAEVFGDLFPAGFDVLQRFIDRDFAGEIAGEFACQARRRCIAGRRGS